jgi:hypothetical protein
MHRAQTHCLCNQTLTCPTYERALAWMLSRPSWPGREHRHAFIMLGAEVPRMARSCDERIGAPLNQRSVYSHVASSILVSTEGRRWCWRDERADGYLVTTPLWWPQFFLYNGTAAQLPRVKSELAVFKSVAIKFCHRRASTAQTGACRPRTRSRCGRR